MTIVSAPRLALVLAAGIALAGCSSSDTPAEHSSADRMDGHTSSSAGLPEGHIEAGEKVANTVMGANQKSCIGCHGADGNAPIDPKYPKIGGQYYDYIAHSLELYRDGDRAGSATTDMMAGQAKELTDQQIADVAAYFGSRPTHLRDLHGLD